MTTPIWKKYWVDLSSYLDDENKVDYTVILQISSSVSQVIYNGRAYGNDDGEECHVCINDVCEDYLKHIDINDITTAGVLGPEVQTFIVKVGSTTVDTAVFVNDWSYDEEIAEIEYDGAWAYFNRPISTDAVAGMFKVVSEYNSEELTHTREGIASGLNLCNAKALYYINSLGGWDYLLLKGGCKESAEYDRAEYRIGEQRTAPNARERINYRNGVAQKWECHTGHITRKGGLRMGELFGSVDIRLWSEDGSLVPVTIDEDSIQLLTVRNNGRQAVEYTFNITLAKERERR